MASTSLGAAFDEHPYLHRHSHCGNRRLFRLLGLGKTGAVGLVAGAGNTGTCGLCLLLTRVDVEHAGRVYAIYGGIYIVASLGWLWAVEGARPDRWDVTGSIICLIDAAIILWAPRAT